MADKSVGPNATFLMADNSRPSPKTPRADVPPIG
jgi:hypothetical protein